MKDVFKSAGITLIGLALFSAFAAERARYAARRDLERAIPGSAFQVSVRPRGALGLAFGEVESATIRGQRFTVQELPFRIEPRGGLLARLGTLKLELRDITLRDLPVRSLDASIPRVRVDGPRVLFNGHFTIRGAESGTGVAVITAEGLSEFMARKRPEFSDLAIKLIPGEALVSGRAAVFLGPTPLEARVKIGVTEGRYLNAAEAKVSISGRAVPERLTQRLLQSLNPIIDVDRDLGLSDWLYVTSAEVGEGILIVRARVTIPLKVVPKPEKP